MKHEADGIQEIGKSLHEADREMQLFDHRQAAFQKQENKSKQREGKDHPKAAFQKQENKAKQREGKKQTPIL